MIIFETWNTPGDFNMALDVELGNLSYELKEAILRLYTWETPTLSFGRHQKFEGINWDLVRNLSIFCVRRPTGGRSVLHHKEITYSVLIPKGHDFYNLRILDLYNMVSNAIIDFLKNIGMTVKKDRGKKNNTPFCFRAPSIYEITLDGRKLVGSAQLRTKRFILQHGSIILDYDRELISNIFNLPLEDVEKSIVGIWNISKVPFEKIIIGLKRSFENILGVGREKNIPDRIVKKAWERASKYIIYGSEKNGEALYNRNSYRKP